MNKVWIDTFNIFFEFITSSYMVFLFIKKLPLLIVP